MLHCINQSQRLQLLQTPDDAYFESDYLVYGLINYKQNVLSLSYSVLHVLTIT